MIPYLFINVLVHNRRSPHFHNKFKSSGTSRIPENKSHVIRAKLRPPYVQDVSSVVPGRRCIFTSTPTFKKNKSQDPKAGNNNHKNPKSANTDQTKPPWSMTGDSQSCCNPQCDQTCTPPPPHNPNPFYNYPQPYIKAPPPPWCSPPKEVLNFCPTPPMPPIPPVSFMKDVNAPVISSSAEGSDGKSDSFSPKHDFDIFEQMGNVLYAKEGSEKYYEELENYFEPNYKGVKYFSYTDYSYYDMRVYMKKYIAFGKENAAESSCNEKPLRNCD